MTARCLQPPTGAAAEAARAHRASVPVLETKRLRLRPATLDDYPLWADIGQGPEMKFLGGPFTEEDIFAGYCIYMAGWMLHGHGLWAVETRAAGDLVGFVSLGLEWGDEEPELGYLLAATARGQGLASEACAAARDHGLELLATFVSYVDEGNEPSHALAARLGAVRDRAAEARIGGGTRVWRHGGQA